MWFDEGFKSSVVHATPKKAKKSEYAELEGKWNIIDHMTAKAKFKFVIYSTSDIYKPTIKHYRIGRTPPRQGYWEELVGVPERLTFMEAQSKDYLYCKLLKDGIEEKGSTMKIPRKL